ncbi:MAG: oligosaccharide flippase family protein, partial [Gracilimonas sp.]|nr:oligosaccharide flippase family protein [Gracilimonas sp.]
ILDTDQFGLTRVLIAIMTISAQIINFGVPNSVIKYYPELSLKTDNKQGLFWAFLVPPVFGLLVFSIIILFFDDLILNLYNTGSTLLSDYFLYIIPLVAFSVAFALLNSFVKAQFNTVFASFLQDVLLRVLMIIDLLLFYFEVISFDLFILIFAGNYGIQYLMLLGYALKNNLLNIRPSFSVFDTETIKKIRTYSFYSFFSGLTMLLIGNIDLLMLGTYNGLAESGIYAIALYVGSVILIPKKSIVKISFPVIANSFQKNDLDNVEKVYKQTSLNQFLTGLLLYIGIVANIDNLYAMLPEEYANGTIVIVIIGLGNLIEMITGANGQIIIASKYFRFDFYSSWILMLLAITLNVLLIPIYGLAGAALATTSSILLYNAVKVIFVWIKLQIQPFSFRLVGIVLTGLILLYLSSLFPGFENIYLDILIRSFMIAILYIGSVWIFKLSDEVNEFLAKYWQKIVNK